MGRGGEGGREKEEGGKGRGEGDGGRAAGRAPSNKLPWSPGGLSFQNRPLLWGPPWVSQVSLDF